MKEAIPVYLSAAASVVAAACAVVSASATLNAVRIAAQEKVFEKKLDACDAVAETTDQLSLTPMAAVTPNDDRSRMIARVNRLLTLFGRDVNDPGERFINQLDLALAEHQRGGPSSQWMGKLLQSALDVDAACREDVRRSAGLRG